MTKMDRIEKLESDVAALTLMVEALTRGVEDLATSYQEGIRTKAVVIVDDDGRAVVRIGSGNSKDGPTYAGVIVYDRQGREQAMLVRDPDRGGYLTLCDAANAESLVHAGVDGGNGVIIARAGDGTQHRLAPGARAQTDNRADGNGAS